MTFHLLASLDEALGNGAEELILAARRRGLLNGIAVGVVREGEAMVRVFGHGVGVASRFELGSVTKTYTAELLAILVGKGVVRLDDPVSRYLRGASAGTPTADEITLEDLATHTSGLPRLPPRVPVLSLDPYRRYDAGTLERYLARRGLTRGRKRGFRYSNLGYSLLGYALGRAAGTGYAALLQRELLDPLGMTETALAGGQRQPGLLRGHRQSGLPTPHWNFDVCAPCGGLCSSIGDQVRWLRWLLEDGERLSLQRRSPIRGGDIALAWMRPAQSEICWHNGATAGFSSWISLDPVRGTGVVLLSNRQAIGLVNTLGGRFQRCLRGHEAGAIGWDYGRARSLVLDPLQMVAATMSPVLSPLVALPLWLRLPVAAAAGYGVERLFGLLRARW
jgi:CubicO group peptidase (beta-lactamase class C family)